MKISEFGTNPHFESFVIRKFLFANCILISLEIISIFLPDDYSDDSSMNERGVVNSPNFESLTSSELTIKSVNSFFEKNNN